MHSSIHIIIPRKSNSYTFCSLKKIRNEVIVTNFNVFCWKRWIECGWMRIVYIPLSQLQKHNSNKYFQPAHIFLCHLLIWWSRQHGFFMICISYFIAPSSTVGFLFSQIQWQSVGKNYWKRVNFLYHIKSNLIYFSTFLVLQSYNLINMNYFLSNYSLKLFDNLSN